jgi:hypothetical protein
MKESFGPLEPILSGFGLVVIGLLYIGVGIWLTHRGSPIRAGLAMVAVAALPLAGQLLLTDSEAPGYAILFVIMLLPPFLLIPVGLAIGGIRLARKQRGSRA